MLRTRKICFPAPPVGGFSLIELMISVAIGLIVAAGALSLIVAINQANSETIQSTRLTQELRTLASVIADDIKRSRRLADPIAMVGQGTANDCPTTPTLPAQPCYPFVTFQDTWSPTGFTDLPKDCVSYGYSGDTSNSYIYNYRAVRLTTANNVGSIELDQLSFDPTANAAGTALPLTATIVPCPNKMTGSTAYVLNSSEVNITSLCFSTVGDAAMCTIDSSGKTCALNTAITPAANEIDVCIAGKLVVGDKSTKAVSRAFVQPIFIRSFPVTSS